MNEQQDEAGADGHRLALNYVSMPQGTSEGMAHMAAGSQRADVRAKVQGHRI